ncbi:hypothetical protein [uncultured Corynebacterium sp.]|uniref:hypothetical protein n=1 Tax=uncultured Corynebacterium sp. TaxID=159447 RepID=UPI0025EF8D75|nr:hypothetical protein [uncultured Corynebacterium sp.]
MEPRLAFALYAQLPSPDDIAARATAAGWTLEELPAADPHGGVLALADAAHRVLVRFAPEVYEAARTPHPLLGRSAAHRMDEVTASLLIFTYPASAALGADPDAQPAAAPETEETPLAFARAHVGFVDTLAHDAIALYSSESAAALDPELFVKASLAPVWLYEADGQIGAYTTGFHRYGLPELQVAPCNREPGEIFAGLSAIAEAVIRSDETPRAGQTTLFGADPTPRVFFDAPWVVSDTIPALTLHL